MTRILTWPTLPTLELLNHVESTYQLTRCTAHQTANFRIFRDVLRIVTFIAVIYESIIPEKLRNAEEIIAESAPSAVLL